MDKKKLSIIIDAIKEASGGVNDPINDIDAQILKNIMHEYSTWPFMHVVNTLAPEIKDEYVFDPSADPLFNNVFVSAAHQTMCHVIARNPSKSGIDHTLTTIIRKLYRVCEISPVEL